MAHLFQYAIAQVGKPELLLKPAQLQAIRSLYEGRDVFVLLPTGFGKSICYEVLPFLYDTRSVKLVRSVVVVVSPLVSLICDRVTSLRSRGVRLGSTTCCFMPRRPSSVLKWKEMLTRPPLSEQVVAIAVDEAHCVSKW